jgi:hypothetical protein
MPLLKRAKPSYITRMGLKQTDDEDLDDQIDRIIEEDREIFDALDS